MLWVVLIVLSWRRKNKIGMRSLMVPRMVRWWVMLMVVMIVLSWRRKNKIGMIS
jgi:hypothetical protein